MNPSHPVPALTVVYAKDIRRVATFYERTLDIGLVEETEAFVIVGNAAFEIAVVRIAGAGAQGSGPEPVRVREETPVKGSFLVQSLEQARVGAEASGGSLKPLSAAWQWRGQLHLDGHDPEGNVVQVRASAAWQPAQADATSRQG